jgi:type II secretion system protein C
VLIGTQVGRNPQEGFAFIGASPRSPRTYKSGALLANNARLREIYSDYVVLERDGHSTRLYAIGKQPAEYSPTQVALLAVGGPTQTSPAVADSHDALTDVVRVSQVFEGDSFSGLIVFANPRSDVFFRLGFRAGDIITAIDGTALSDPASAIATLHALLNGQTLMVTIKRDSQSSTFAADGSLLSSDNPLGSGRELNGVDN